jgi:hypothetical protein
LNKNDQSLLKEKMIYKTIIKMENDKQKKSIVHKKPYNSNVCFLCYREGHYGSPTSCYAFHASNQKKKIILIKI